MLDALEERDRTAARTRFVIADDDPHMLEIASAMLAAAYQDAELYTAADGQEALSLMREDVPTLALIDLNMPKMNGFELTTALRADERTREVPIVVMTGVGGASDWQRLSEQGANAFLVKPFDVTQLEHTVRRLLGDT